MKTNKPEGEPVMSKPVIDEAFADNGEHSHWRLIDPKTGSNLWSEDPNEDAARGFPVKQPEPVIGERIQRYTWDLLVPYLRANKIRLVWYGPEMLNTVDWSRPAMVDVPSLTAPDKGDHIIFWDGEKVIDPSAKELKYTSLPDKIHNVYQLKP